MLCNQTINSICHNFISSSVCDMSFKLNNMLKFYALDLKLEMKAVKPFRLT